MVAMYSLGNLKSLRLVAAYSDALATLAQIKRHRDGYNQVRFFALANLFSKCQEIRICLCLPDSPSWYVALDIEGAEQYKNNVWERLEEYWDTYFWDRGLNLSPKAVAGQTELVEEAVRWRRSVRVGFLREVVDRTVWGARKRPLPLDYLETLP